jgi:hypothetical protein
VTAVPPEDIIPDKNADQPKRVRFLIDYKDPVTAATVVARLTVLGIRVSGLPSIHLLEDNSPFVQLRCGHFRFSTEINALAGEYTCRAAFSFECLINRRLCYLVFPQGVGRHGTT